MRFRSPFAMKVFRDSQVFFMRAAFGLSELAAARWASSSSFCRKPETKSQSSRRLLLLEDVHHHQKIMPGDSVEELI